MRNTYNIYTTQIQVCMYLFPNNTDTASKAHIRARTWHHLSAKLLHIIPFWSCNSYQHFPILFQQFPDVLSHLERRRLFEAGIGGSVLWLPARVWHQARPELLHLQLVRGGRLQLPRALLPHQMRRVRHVRETGGREDGRTRRRGGRKRQEDRGRPNVRTKRTEH